MEGYLGTILMWAGNFAPQNWVYCWGQTLSIAEYQALYAVIGLTYGGDGRTNFKLPDLRSRMPLCAGTGIGLPSYQPGYPGGSSITTLGLNNLPQHTHNATFHPTGGGSGGGASLAVSTAAPSETAPLLENGETAYLANAAVGGNLKGLYTKTAPAAGASATIPVEGGGGGITGGSVTVDPTGFSQAFDNMPPYLPINFIICVDGQFPTRS